jgi:hypothetical protein
VRIQLRHQILNDRPQILLTSVMVMCQLMHHRRDHPDGGFGLIRPDWDERI